jgi:glycosyltransferase involved in cell wall biosynthesis
MDTSVTAERSDRRPKVTVLMPVFNGERYLAQAIESILAQTFTDFEFLIINDGSTDRTVEILHSYRDPRIRLLHNERNLGLIETLNEGLAASQGELIARMDCDDISMPRRLEHQVAFLESRQGVGVCGAWVEVFQEGSRSVVMKYPLDHDSIKINLFLYEPWMAHPVTMIRKSVLQGGNARYRPEFSAAEDYDLWSRLIHTTSFANLPLTLLRYRTHASQISTAKKNTQENTSERVVESMLKAMVPEADDHDVMVHKALVMGAPLESRHPLRTTLAWARKLAGINSKTAQYDKDIFSRKIFDKWFKSGFQAMCLRWLSVRGRPLLSYRENVPVLVLREITKKLAWN